MSGIAIIARLQHILRLNNLGVSVRSTTPIGLNMEPCLSYLPEPNDLSKKPVEVKGGLKAFEG